MKHLLTKYVLLWLMLLSFNATAQQCCYTLTVVITDDLNHPVPYTAVQLINATTTQGNTTLANGQAKFNNLTTANYTLRVHNLLYTDTVLNIAVTANQTVRVKLNHTAANLHEVHIHQERTPTTATQNYMELSQLNLLKQQGKPLAKMLEQLPGITTLNTGASVSKPVINGLHSNRILLLNNGVRQEGQQWGAEHAPEIDPFNAGSITVIKGANAIQYGSDAVAGVLLVNPAPLPDSAGLSGSVLVNTQTNGRLVMPAIMIQQRLKRKPSWAYRLQTSGKKVGNISTPTYTMGNTGTQELNGNVLAQYNHNAHRLTLNLITYNATLGIFRGSHIGNLTDLNRAIANTGASDSAAFLYAIDRPKQLVSHHTAMVHYQTNVAAHGVLNVQYAFQANYRKEFDNHNVYVNGVLKANAPQSALELFTHTADASYEYTTEHWGHGKIGGNYMYQINNNTAQSRVFIPNYSSTNAGIYYLHYAHINKFNIELGLRQDVRNSSTYERNASNNLFSRVRTFNATLGSVGASYYLSNNVKCIVNSGLAWRAPAPNELYSNGLHHGVAAIEYGNQNLNVERALNNLAAVNGTVFNGKLSFNAEVFYNHFFNFINLVPVLPATLTIRGAFPTFKFVQLPAQLYGSNVKLSYLLTKHVSYTGVLSTVRGYNLLSNEFLLGLPSDRLLNEVAYNFTTKPSQQYSVSLTHTWVDKQHRVNYASDYSLPPAAYNLVGATASANYTLTNKKEIVVLLACNNLLNSQYRDYMNRFKYYTNDVGRNVSLTAIIKF